MAVGIPLLARCRPLARQRTQLEASRRSAAATSSAGQWMGLQGEVDDLVDYVGTLSAKRSQHRWQAERAALLARLSAVGGSALRLP